MISINCLDSFHRVKCSDFQNRECNVMLLLMLVYETGGLAGALLLPKKSEARFQSFFFFPTRIPEQSIKSSNLSSNLYTRPKQRAVKTSPDIPLYALSTEEVEPSVSAAGLSIFR